MEDSKHPSYAGLPVERETPEHGPADESGVRAQSQRLEHIGAAPDAAIDEDGNPIVYCIDDIGQGVERGDGGVELSPAVVGNDQGASAEVESSPRISRVGDTLEDQGQPGAGGEPFERSPVECGIELAGDERLERGAVGIGEAGLPQAAKIGQVDLVRETEAIAGIALAFALNGYGGREAQGFTACLLRALDQLPRELAIAKDVKLKPEQGGGTLARDFLDGGSGECTDHVNRVGGSRRAGGRDFTIRVCQPLERGGRYEHGRGQSVTEQLNARIDAADIDQYARAQPITLESLAVGAQRHFVFGTTRVVIKDVARQHCPRRLLELFEIYQLIDGHDRETPARSGLELPVDLSLLRSIDGFRLPALEQKRLQIGRQEVACGFVADVQSVVVD